LSNSATVSAADGFTDTDLDNNSATDVDLTTRVFNDGFEQTVMSKRFEARAMQLTADSVVARLPVDVGRKAVLVARAASQTGMVLVHARRHEGMTELRLSRFEQGEWQQGEWIPIRESRVRLEW
jgi:hypothetical protein